MVAMAETVAVEALLGNMRGELSRFCTTCSGPSAERQWAAILRNHCLYDIEFFARAFFPHLCRREFSPWHRALFLDRALELEDSLPGREGYRKALAAPRGSAKSTLKSLLFVLHDLAYKREPYILLFSATLPQAEQRLKNLRREIERNDHLRAVYGDALAPSGPASRRALQIGRALIEAHSSGSEVRGISYGQWRPTKIVLDDVENSEDVENADLRARLEDWFREVIENLGDSYTNIDVVGTVLHPDGLLAHLLERPDFQSRRWRSILHFSKQTQLWEEWKTIYSDLSNRNRVAYARRFFNAHREEMLAGTEVFWPDKESYYDLMVQLTTRGRRAFFKEKQNDPLRADHAVFDPSTFRWFRRDGDALVLESSPEPVPLRDLRIVGFLDSAMGGKGRRGDFAAIATVGMDASNRLFVLDVWLDHATPSEQAERIFAQHDLWNYSAFGIEAIGFQGLMVEPIETLRQQRRAAGQKSDLPIVEITPRGSKVERVAALEPLIYNGWILFERALGEEFLAQIEQFPSGRHDDGPDALASAVELARRPKVIPQLLGRTRPSGKIRGY